MSSPIAVVRTGVAGLAPFLLLSLVTLTGCGSSQPVCPNGSQCGPAAPVAGGLVGPLSVTADGRTISGRFLCGGLLSATETASRVTLTFLPNKIRAGAGTCAMVPARVVLAKPVGHRAVVDGVDHRPLVLSTAAPAGR